MRRRRPGGPTEVAADREGGPAPAGFPGMTRSRKLRRALAITAVAVVLSLGAAACGGGGGSGGSAGADGPAGGRAAGGEDLPATEFAMEDGTTVTLAELVDGRPLVVNYFASWCAPCRAEMPDFATVHGDVGDEVGFVGVALTDPQDASAALVELTGVRYAWGSDPDGTLYAALGGFSMPSTWYVSPHGKIVERDNGQIDEDTLRDRLDDLFGVS